MAKSIDVQLINAFYDATVESLQSMGSMSINRRGISLKQHNKMIGDFYAVIGLSSGMVGNCAINLSRELAHKISLQMFGFEVESEEMLMDGLGEISNLIAGGGRRRLAGSRHIFEISPPTVLANHDTEQLDIYNPAKTECIIIECGVADFTDPLNIELAFVPENV